MNFTRIFAAAFGCAILLSACDDDKSTTIGSSLVTSPVKIVVDSTFQLTGRAIRNQDIQSRTIQQLLGVLDAKEYGKFSSEIVTQFMPALTFDTTGIKRDYIDSIKLMFFMENGNFTGDSLVPMGMKIYPLTKQLEAPIYSNFDPTGYYDPSNCWTPSSAIYTASALHSDSLNSMSYRIIEAKLPKSFALEIFDRYLTHPETFATPEAFTKYFPGLYIANSFGSGRVVNIGESRINMYYRYETTIETDSTSTDTILSSARTIMGVTPEILTNNIIKLQLSDQLTQRINSGENLLVAPTGYDIDFTFPAQEIMSKFRNEGGPNAVLNNLTFELPLEYVTNDYGITAPPYVLMVLKNKRQDFFADNKINDDVTSFLGTFDLISLEYKFNDMRSYILDLLEKENVTADDYTFTLTPVTLVTEQQTNSYGQTSNVVTAINPYVDGPAMVKVLLDKVKITLVFTRQ